MSKQPSVPRRRFLHTSVLCGAGLIAAGPRLAGATPARKLGILEPIHGAVLHRRLGREIPCGLEIEVSGVAPSGAQVLVQGRAATRDGEKFRGTALLRERENEIVVTRCPPKNIVKLP